jgi:hypothetical protein
MQKKKHKHGFHHKINMQVREMEIAFGVYGNNNRRKMHGIPLERHCSIVKNREMVRKNEQSREDKSLKKTKRQSYKNSI